MFDVLRRFHLSRNKSANNSTKYTAAVNLSNSERKKYEFKSNFKHEIFRCKRERCTSLGDEMLTEKDDQTDQGVILSVLHSIVHAAENNF